MFSFSTISNPPETLQKPKFKIGSILQSPPEGVQSQESAHEYLGVLLKSRKQAESQEVKQTMPWKAESGSICEASPSGVRKGGGL